MVAVCPIYNVQDESTVCVEIQDLTVQVILCRVWPGLDDRPPRLGAFTPNPFWQYHFEDEQLTGARRW